MKRCSYCGKEYSDEATLCSVDHEPLVEIGPHPPLPEEQIETTVRDTLYLTFPDYQWSARDAWKCVAFLVFFGLVLWFGVNILIWLLVPPFRAWYASGAGFFSRSLLRYAIELLIAAYFARTETLAAFWQGFSLKIKPTELVWSGIVCALAIRFFGHIMSVHGWSHGVPFYDLKAFQEAAGPERYFYLGPLLLLAPLFEESIYRGFLYKAFRGSYSMATSTALIVVWTTYTHWLYYSHSWAAAVDLSLLTVVQCYLREKSASLWDCIFCHFAFNFSLLFVGDPLR